MVSKNWLAKGLEPFISVFLSTVRRHSYILYNPPVVLFHFTGSLCVMTYLRLNCDVFPQWGAGNINRTHKKHFDEKTHFQLKNSWRRPCQKTSTWPINEKFFNLNVRWTLSDSRFIKIMVKGIKNRLFNIGFT